RHLVGVQTLHDAILPNAFERPLEDATDDLGAFRDELDLPAILDEPAWNFGGQRNRPSPGSLGSPGFPDATAFGLALVLSPEQLKLHFHSGHRIAPQNLRRVLAPTLQRDERDACIDDRLQGRHRVPPALAADAVQILDEQV